MESEPVSFGPRPLWQIIGCGFKAYAVGIAAYLAIAVITVVPVALYSAGLWAIGDHARTAADGWSSDLAKWLSTDFLVPAGTLLLMLLAYPLMHGALIQAAAQKLLGRQMDIGQAYSAALRRAGGLIGAGLTIILAESVMMASVVCLLFALHERNASLFILAGVLAAGLPFALHFHVKSLLVFPMLVLEDSPLAQSFARSSAAVAGHWRRSFGAWVLLAAAPACAAGLLVSIPLDLWDSQGVPGTLVLLAIFPGVVIAPLAAVTQTLLYFDLCARSAPRGTPAADCRARVRQIGL